MHGFGGDVWEKMFPRVNVTKGLPNFPKETIMLPMSMQSAAVTVRAISGCPLDAAWALGIGDFSKMKCLFHC